MCDKCREEGYYNQMRPFPENIQPCNIHYNEKFLKSKFHEDNLVLCRTSRKMRGSTSWYCNGCQREFDEDIWSFYCTKCDFDLCSSCMGYK